MKLLYREAYQEEKNKANSLNTYANKLQQTQKKAYLFKLKLIYLPNQMKTHQLRHNVKIQKAYYSKYLQ